MKMRPFLSRRGLRHLAPHLQAPSGTCTGDEFSVPLEVFSLALFYTSMIRHGARYMRWFRCSPEVPPSRLPTHCLKDVTSTNRPAVTSLDVTINLKQICMPNIQKKKKKTIQVSTPQNSNSWLIIYFSSSAAVLPPIDQVSGVTDTHLRQRAEIYPKNGTKYFVPHSSVSSSC
jgi:hypothetical protein